MLVMEIFVGLITGTVLGLALGAGTAWLTLRSRSGEADAGVAGQTLYAAAKGAGPFPVVVSQTVVGLETERRMLAATSAGVKLIPAKL